MKTSTIASIKAQKGAHACPHTLECRIEPVLPSCLRCCCGLAGKSIQQAKQ
ncbi:hypothetical protein [Achromobacter anxifer]